ncbi:MAG: hypothetical protein HY906_02710 [Deltaproteobacteria bacterium]|nr:hypothetical protein [Deltaproteobacteria bacterium]
MLQLRSGAAAGSAVCFAYGRWLELIARVGHDARDFKFGGATDGVTASFSF